MSTWTIHDYAEINGRNLVADWLASVPEGAQGAIALRLLKMEQLRNWPEKWASTLSGYEGIVELRIPHNRVQYRPLGMYLPGMKFVLLTGAIEKGNKLPQRNIDTAVRRRKNVLRDLDHVRPHQY